MRHLDLPAPATVLTSTEILPISSHPKLNYYAIVPKGGEAWWTQPHDRDQRFPAAKRA